MKALIVLSGGQDSTTCLYMAREQGYKEIHAVTFNYGQRHRRELAAAGKIADMAQVTSHEIIRLDGILHSTSPLIDQDAQLEQYQDHAQMEATIGDRVELTFVPMRNALFLTIAANRAVALGCRDIYTGVCQADNANYPDCRQGFIFAQEAAINHALGFTRASQYDKRLSILAPLINIAKPDSIWLARKLPGWFQALAWSHTAYDGSYPPSGKDHATVLRAHAFEVAGMPDPLILRAWLTGAVVTLPQTGNYTAHGTVLSHAKKMYDTAGLELTLRMLENHFVNW